MRGCAPFKEEGSGLNVDFLEQVVEKPALTSSHVVGCEICCDGLVDALESGLATWQDVEFVQVS